MQTLEKQHQSTPTIPLETKSILVTEKEQHFKVVLEDSSSPVHFMSWAKGIAEQAKEGVEKVTVHFYFHIQETKPQLKRLSDTRTWKDLVEPVSTVSKSMEIFLDSVEISVQTESLDNTLSKGFQEGKKLRTTSQFIAVEISEVCPELVQNLAETFYAAYNHSLLVIHLSFPDFDRTTRLLERMGIAQHQYHTIDTSNLQHRNFFGVGTSFSCLLRNDCNQVEIIAH